MMTDFATWLTTEIDNRGWTNSELARRAGMRQSTISMLISGHNKPGLDVCIGIAKAFRISPEEVLRRSGLIPQISVNDDDPTILKVVEYLRRLDMNDRVEVLTYTMFRYAQAMAAIEQKSSK